MRYITDQHAADIPGLADLDPKDQRQVLADAGRVYTRVQRQPWITDTELREYGERNDLPPDRMNAALALLEQTNQLLPVEDRPGHVTEAITEPAAAR